MTDVLLKVWRRRKAVKSFSQEIPVGGSYGGMLYGKKEYLSREELCFRIPDTRLSDVGWDTIDRLVNEHDARIQNVPQVGTSEKKLLPDKRYYALY